MVKHDPLLSFIIPIYKTPPEVLELCLKSIRDMSYKRIEIIAVFDGPPSLELPEIVRKYTTPERMLEIEHGGAPKARNAGAKLAQGQYFVFWDSDCYPKPEMAKRWMEEFETTGADFVYSGYEFKDHSNGIAGVPFDPYLLTCNNYIATNFPMKREIFPGFDETLVGAQDWDMWLTIVERGGKGSFIEGYGYITEPPNPESITGKAWNPENFRKTHWTVREKHGIPHREIVIGSAMERMKGLHIAKMLNADFSQFLDFRVDDYKLAFNLGFGENIWFNGANKGCVRVQYWMPWDITGLENYGLLKSINMLEKLKDHVDHHFVNEMVSQKRLARLFEFVGLKAPEIVPLPSEVEDPETRLPDIYRVLLDIDETYMPVFKTIKQDLPYIPIDDLNFKTNPTADISKYSLLVSFQNHPTVNEGIRRFLINGRNIISNVQAPYCGNFDMDISMKEFKQAMIRAIRDGRYLKFNAAGQSYYRDQVDPKAFEAKLKSLMPQKIEVV